MCLLLRRLEEARPGLLDSFDILAGTSAGAATAAIISVAPTSLEGLDRAIAFWRGWRPYEGAGPLSPRTLMALSGRSAFLTHSKLYSDLQDILGGKRLSEISRKLVIPTFSLDNRASLKSRRHWSIQIYHNLSPEIVDSRLNLVDIVLRSSSVPLLHPVFQGHVDGGLYANNPSLNALSLATDYLDANLRDIMVLSMGQGQSNKYMDLADGDVGYGTWLMDPANPTALIKLVMESNLQATNYQCSRILEDRFIRVDPVLHTDIELVPNQTQEDYNSQQEAMASQVDLAFILDEIDQVPGFLRETAAPVS